MKLVPWVLREWRHFKSSHVLLLVTMVLGLSGVLVIERLKEAFLSSIRHQERELLSSDLALRARRALSDAEVEQFRQAFADVLVDHQRVIDLSSMLYAPERALSRLVEVRVVPVGFPFYGQLVGETGPVQLTGEHELFTQHCLYLHEEVARLMSIEVGEKLKLGAAEFRYCGKVVLDSTQGFRGFALAPRIYLGASNLARTELLGFGAIAAHAEHLKLRAISPGEVEARVKSLTLLFNDPALKINRPQDTSEQTARAGSLFADYLQLASLVALILAVVGGFYLFRTLVHRRLRDVAVLRSLGISSATGRLLLLAPLLATFLMSVPLALAFSSLLFPLITRVLEQLVNTVLPASGLPWSTLSFLPLVLLLIVGALLGPIEEAVRAPVMGLLQEQSQVGRVPKRVRLLLGLLTLTSLLALSSWAAHSFKVGALFVLGLVFAVALLTFVLFVISRLGEWVYRHQTHLARPIGLLGGLVIRRLLRRPAITLITVIALGLGAVLVSLLGHLEVSLSQEFTMGQADRPELFLFDVQDEQVEPLREFLVQKGVKIDAISPMVRAKLESVNGKAFRQQSSRGLFQTREEENAERFRARMMNLSWASELNSSERLEAGKLFREVQLPEGIAPLSLEIRFAQRLGLRPGDRITFDILGVPLTGEVVNIRSVKWTSFRPNFFIVVAPGFIEDAPKSWLAGVGGMGAEGRAKLQNELAQNFANVSAIDVTQLTERLLELFSRLKGALELMALFAFIVGVVVVTAMAQDQVIRRGPEVMLEKTLGLSPLQVTGMVLGEFLLLSVFSFLVGAFAGGLIAALISTLVFDGNWTLELGLIFGLTGAGLLLVLLPLLLLARRIFALKPSGLLQGA